MPGGRPGGRDQTSSLSDRGGCRAPCPRCQVSLHRATRQQVVSHTHWHNCRRALYQTMAAVLITRSSTVKAIILTRRIYNDFPKLTGLRVPKVTILTHSPCSIGQYMYRFLYNDFYFNDRFLLVNSLELALRYIYGFYSTLQTVSQQVTGAWIVYPAHTYFSAISA